MPSSTGGQLPSHPWPRLIPYTANPEPNSRPFPQRGMVNSK